MPRSRVSRLNDFVRVVGLPEFHQAKSIARSWTSRLKLGVSGPHGGVASSAGRAVAAGAIGPG